MGLFDVFFGSGLGDANRIAAANDEAWTAYNRRLADLASDNLRSTPGKLIAWPVGAPLPKPVWQHTVTTKPRDTHKTRMARLIARRKEMAR